MPQHRKSYTAKRSQRTSLQVRESTIGTHVSRGTAPSPRRRAGRASAYNAALVRRARIRRIAVAAVAIIVVLAIAVGAGIMAFRGVVGGSLSLKGSDAADALAPSKTGDPSYALVSVELGAVAAPLDNGGPDVFFLAWLDPESQSLALVGIPSTLQITTENQSDSVSAIANTGDAALISAISTFAKIDISHFVKIDSPEDVACLVDALGGIQVDVRQAVDDPHAGSVCIPEGVQTLDGKTALVYLRAENLEYGAEDRLVNQLAFASAFVADLFSSEGSFDSRLESIGSYIETDLSLNDLESVNSWLGGTGAGDIKTTVLPGYFVAVTNASGSGDERYVSSSSEVANLIDDLENNRDLVTDSLDAVDMVSPSSFTVEIQNGTSINGAASTAADELKAAGFKIGDVGNAEQPIYEETLVVYRSDDEKGLSRAKTVIDSYGVGRAVDGDAYYTFEADVLLIIGADNKPTD